MVNGGDPAAGAGIEAVVKRLEAIRPATGRLTPAADAAFDDGVSAFNELYLDVTKAVETKCDEAGFFNDPDWIADLDVVFADFYFAAIEASEAQTPDGENNVPREWRPLFERRDETGVFHDLQFALAGMNAHINHDLPFAVIDTCEKRGITPDKSTPYYQDFQKVNQVLKGVEAEVQTRYSTGAVANVDHAFGNLDTLFAMWSITNARAAAWGWAEIL